MRAFWSQRVRIGILADQPAMYQADRCTRCYATQLLRVELYDGANDLLGHGAGRYSRTRKRETCVSHRQAR